MLHLAVNAADTRARRWRRSEIGQIQGPNPRVSPDGDRQVRNGGALQTSSVRLA